MILGRLFKFHPTFDQVLVDLLIWFEENKIDAHVILIAEKHRSWNNKIYNRLFQRLLATYSARSAANLVNNNNTEQLYMAVLASLTRLHFISYSNYVPALLAASVVLDTFPYGGII